MGLFTRPAPDDRALRRRVGELEDDVASLERRFESLRGSVTGALRRLRLARETQDDEIAELELDSDRVVIDEHALGYDRRFKGG